MQNNRELYEANEVVGKYAANSTRVRCLNEAEKIFIDRFDIKDKKVLVIGSGAGRVPANLLLFGNFVRAIELSTKLDQVANKNFPAGDFTRLALEQGDATDLHLIPDNYYDVVFFPQNGIDLISPLEFREKAILEMSKKVKKGGVLAFSSHNKLAYHFSYKVGMKNKILNSFSDPFFFKKENVTGGGILFKGNPDYVIKQAERVSSCKFLGFTCDCRNKIDKFFARRFSMAKYIFPYILYVFKKD